MIEMMTSGYLVLSLLEQNAQSRSSWLDEHL